MKSGAISILVTIIAPVVLGFFVWVASAVTTNQNKITGNKAKIDSVKYILHDIRDSQRIINSDIKKLLQRK